MLETSLVNETSLLCITVLSLALKKKSLGVGTEFYLGLEPNSCFFTKRQLHKRAFTK